MQWRKWRNWRKIASRWRFELDAKSGLLEAGDFGENGDRLPRISAPLGAKKKIRNLLDVYSSKYGSKN